MGTRHTSGCVTSRRALRTLFWNLFNAEQGDRKGTTASNLLRDYPLWLAVVPAAVARFTGRWVRCAEVALGVLAIDTLFIGKDSVPTGCRFGEIQLAVAHLRSTESQIGQCTWLWDLPLAENRPAEVGDRAVRLCAVVKPIRGSFLARQNYQAPHQGLGGVESGLAVILLSCAGIGWLYERAISY